MGNKGKIKRPSCGLNNKIPDTSAKKFWENKSITGEIRFFSYETAPRDWLITVQYPYIFRLKGTTCID